MNSSQYEDGEPKAPYETAGESCVLFTVEPPSATMASANDLTLDYEQLEIC